MPAILDSPHVNFGIAVVCGCVTVAQINKLMLKPKLFADSHVLCGNEIPIPKQKRLVHVDQNAYRNKPIDK